MKLYKYDKDNYNRSRGYSFDHPTNMKRCIDNVFKTIMNEKFYNVIPYRKLSVIRREAYPTILLDIGSYDILIHTNFAELHLYQRRGVIDTKLSIKLGSLFLYERKWK